jgi:hypothetical protein
MIKWLYAFYIYDLFLLQHEESTCRAQLDVIVPELGKNFSNCVHNSQTKPIQKWVICVSMCRFL